MFVFKDINGLAPSYLSEILRNAEFFRSMHLRSQGINSGVIFLFLLLLPRCGTSYSPNSCTIIDPTLFKAELKTFFNSNWLLIPSSTVTLSHLHPLFTCLYLLLYVFNIMCFMFLFQFVSTVEHFGQLLGVVKCYINKCWLIDCVCISIVSKEMEIQEAVASWKAKTSTDWLVFTNLIMQHQSLYINNTKIKKKSFNWTWNLFTPWSVRCVINN